MRAVGTGGPNRRQSSRCCRPPPLLALSPLLAALSPQWRPAVTVIGVTAVVAVVVGSLVCCWRCQRGRPRHRNGAATPGDVDQRTAVHGDVGPTPRVLGDVQAGRPLPEAGLPLREVEVRVLSIGWRTHLTKNGLFSGRVGRWMPSAPSARAAREAEASAGHAVAPQLGPWSTGPEGSWR